MKEAKISKPSDVLLSFMAGQSDLLLDAPPFSTWPECLKSALRLILPSSSQIALFVGPEFRAYYNDAYALAVGNKHPKALGRPAKEAWSEIWDELEPLFHSVLAGETVSAKDRPFTFDRSGVLENVWFDISYSPICDDAGVTHGICCIVSETTDRVRGERALRESESRLRAALNGANVGIAGVDHEGRIIMANSHLAELFGGKGAEISGLALADLFGSENSATLDELFSVDALASDTREISVRRADGAQAWISVSVSRIRTDEVVPPEAMASYCFVARDVTERRRETARALQMAAIIAGSEDAILAVGLDTRVTSWNDGAAKLYGYSEEEVLGRPITFLLTADRKDEESGILVRIKSGERVESYETTRVHKDGHEIPVSLTVSPIFDEYGNVIGASKIARDISGRKAVERMQEILMREMQHRVKNILATVLAIARQSFLSYRHHTVATFTDRIYALARAQSLLTRETTSDVALAELVEEVVSPYPAAQVARVGPDVTLPSGQVLTLTLALHELATNAAKYGALSVPEGRVSITWDLSADDGGEQILSLAWHENGGPRVIVPGTHGFGSTLIRDILTAELGATVTFDFAPEGVVFTSSMRLTSQVCSA